MVASNGKPRSRKRWFFKLPVIGKAFELINAYVYWGDVDSSQRLAPLRLWFRAFFWQLLVSGVLAILSSKALAVRVCLHGAQAEVSAGDLINAVLPNLVGFGIGVYALLFALSNRLIRSVDEIARAKRATGQAGSILAFSAEFAFPLLVLVATIGVGTLNRLYPQVLWLDALAWAAFWFSLVCVAELVFTLHKLGVNQLLLGVHAEEHSDGG